MELISEQKIIDSIYSNRTVTSEIEAYSEVFTSGVSFAEKELQNLAIEFAKWINDNYDMTEDRYVWTNWQEDHSTEKCFELFLEWRKKQY